MIDVSYFNELSNDELSFVKEQIDKCMNSATPFGSPEQSDDTGVFNQSNENNMVSLLDNA